MDGVLIEPEELASAYNPTILQTLLKDIMGFDGFVNSDSGIITQGIDYGAEDMTPGGALCRRHQRRHRT